MDERRGRAKIRDNTANTLATIAANPNPTTMTPEQQQIAIAEACGWKNFNA
jgi:hypothetical protein